MSDEAKLRAEYLASDYPSGSAGYRSFFVDRIAKLEAQAVEDADTIIKLTKKVYELTEAAKAVVDSVNAWGTTGDMYTVDAAEFEALAALIQENKDA